MTPLVRKCPLAILPKGKFCRVTVIPVKQEADCERSINHELPIWTGCIPGKVSMIETCTLANEACLNRNH